MIQRLFSTGLLLQGTRAKAAGPGVQHRIDQAIADLDSTIRDIRSTVFQLQPNVSAGIRDSLHALLSEYAGALGFTPELRTTGPLDTPVPRTISDELLAVLRQVLSSIARQEKATRTSVEVGVETDADGRRWVRLQVTDDGGVVSTTGSWLRNIRERAIELGGTVSIGDREPSETQLDWRTPLDG